MAWKMAPSLFPVFSVSFTFFPHSLAFSLTPLSPFVPLFVTPSPWFHHGNPSTECLSLSLLMAQLLALMHFKRTAAATSQSDGKYMSSSNLHNLCPFFHPVLCLCSDVLHFVSPLLQLSDSGHHL